MIRLYFDGGCYPNPGRIGKSGTVIYKDGELILKDSHIIEGERITNNLMEYDGLYQGLIFLRDNNLSYEQIEIYGDSLMAINQLKNGFKHMKVDKPNKTYKPYKQIAFKVKDIINDFSNLSFNWIPREQNSEADELTHMDFTGLDKEYLKVVA